MSATRYYLHHHPLDPSSRRVRLALAEKEIPCELIPERPWEPRAAYLALNPAGEVPTLIVDSGTAKAPFILSSGNAICEYLEEAFPNTSLLGTDISARAEVRRLIYWFENKMFREVTDHLITEKAFKRLQGQGEPDSARIHAAYYNIHGHLSYIGWLTEHRNWLAGDHISFADLAAAAQLSVVDYLGDVPWDKHPEAKDWYARIKSRPAFRPLLGDYVAGLIPAACYANLDF